MNPEDQDFLKRMREQIRSGAGVSPAQQAAIRAARLARRARRLQRMQRQQQRQARAQAQPPAARPTPPPAATPRPAARQSGAGLTPESEALINRLTSLEGRVQLGAVYDAVGRLDGDLAQFPLTLETLRQEGYVHSGQLEDRLDQLDEQWDDLRPRLDQLLQTQSQQAQRLLDPARQRVRRASAQHNPALLTAATGALDGLENQVRQAESAANQMLAGLQQEMSTIERAIQQAQWMLARLKESPAISLRDSEAPITAVEGRWLQHENEGPQGILFLTDQRLLFEQREKVAVKKILGLISTETETVQKLLLTLEASDIESVEGQESGGFLGLGKSERLALIARQPVTRAAFELEGRDSAEFAALVQRVVSGQIDEDRADDYSGEVEEAAALQAQFPAACPNCLAPLPTPARGVASVTCDYCSSVIKPTLPAG